MKPPSSPIEANPQIHTLPDRNNLLWKSSTSIGNRTLSSVSHPFLFSSLPHKLFHAAPPHIRKSRLHPEIPGINSKTCPGSKLNILGSKLKNQNLFSFISLMKSFNRYFLEMFLTCFVQFRENLEKVFERGKVWKGTMEGEKDSAALLGNIDRSNHLARRNMCFIKGHYNQVAQDELRTLPRSAYVQCTLCTLYTCGPIYGFRCLSTPLYYVDVKIYLPTLQKILWLVVIWVTHWFGGWGEGGSGSWEVKPHLKLPQKFATTQARWSHTISPLSQIHLSKAFSCQLYLPLIRFPDWLESSVGRGTSQVSTHLHIC